MNKNNALILIIGAMLVLVISLPLEWMSIQNASANFSGPFQELGNRMTQTLGKVSMSVTGLNGHVTFLFKMPIWLIVVIGLIGALLSMLNTLKVTSMPQPVPLILLGFSILYMIIALLIAIGSGNASVGIGVFVGLLGNGLAIIHVLAGQSPEQENIL